MRSPLQQQPARSPHQGLPHSLASAWTDAPPSGSAAQIASKAAIAMETRIMNGA